MRKWPILLWKSMLGYGGPKVLGCSEILALERVSFQEEANERSFAIDGVIEPVCDFLGQVEVMDSYSVWISRPGSRRQGSRKNQLQWETLSSFSGNSVTQRGRKQQGSQRSEAVGSKDASLDLGSWLSGTEKQVFGFFFFCNFSKASLIHI